MKRSARNTDIAGIIFIAIAKRRTLKTFCFLRSKKPMMVIISCLERSLFMDSAQPRAASFLDWGKRVSVLQHTLPKRKSLSIYAGAIDDAAVRMRFEMATRHFSFNCLYAETNHTIEFTPLCF